MRARSTRLTWPFSSDTTTTTASVCSVMPERSAVARPEALALERRLGERQQRPGAPGSRSPRTITAPSWSGLRGMKIVSSRSAERSPWIMTPVSAISSRPGLALQDDQRAVALGGEGGCGPRDLRRDMLRDCRCSAGDISHANGSDPADPFEATPELRLEDDDEGEDADNGARLRGSA